jgi:hypothetical protein
MAHNWQYRKKKVTNKEKEFAFSELRKGGSNRSPGPFYPQKTFIADEQVTIINNNAIRIRCKERQPRQPGMQPVEFSTLIYKMDFGNQNQFFTAQSFN